MSGIKTKEHGGLGFNQLVCDDSNRQLRIQLATTQHHTQLNMGHLIHQADNHRGSFRGEGWELRTDAYGAVRMARGLHISTYGLGSPPTGQHAAHEHPAHPTPAGDNAPGMALARQLNTLAKTLDQAAATHQTVKLAAAQGSQAAGQSTLSDALPPAAALQQAASGMVNDGGFEQAVQDAGSKNITPKEGTVPHSTDPIISVAARAGLGLTAGQDIQVAAEDNITIASGDDTQIITGGAMRIHTGQAIGMLAGAIKPGDQAAGTGLSLMAANGNIHMQAQSGQVEFAAKGLIDVMSAHADVNWAAAKRIVIKTAGGACIDISGGNIDVSCPGTLTIKAGVKSFVGPEVSNFALPQMPRSVCVPCLRSAMESGSPLVALS